MDGLDPGTGSTQVDHIVIGPEDHRDPGPGGSKPELFAAHGQIARGRHHPVELHRATPIDHRGRWYLGILPERLDRLRRLDRGGCGRRVEVGGQPQRQQVLGCRANVLTGGEPVGGVAHVQGLVRVAVVGSHPGVHRGLRGQHRLEGLGVVKELAAEGSVKPLDLPGRGGTSGARRGTGCPVPVRRAATTALWLPLVTGGATVKAVTSNHGNATDPRGASAPRGNGAAGVPATYEGLRALFINCTLKRSPERSNTQGLIELSAAIMRRQGVEVKVLRAIDHDITVGCSQT